MLPGVNDYHANHAAPTQPPTAAGVHSKFSPPTRSPTTITTVAVPDGIYNPPPASAANAAKPGPAAIGGEVRDMMELMHRREAAPFASTDAARAEQRVHEEEMLSFAQEERRRRLDMEAEYERKRQLGLLDRSGIGAGFAEDSAPSHAVPTTRTGPRLPSAVDDLAARAAAAVGSVMAPRMPPGAGDGTLHRTPEFRLASTALTEETWDTKIRSVDQFAVSQQGPMVPATVAAPHAPAAPLPPARVVPLPPAPVSAAAAADAAAPPAPPAESHAQSQPHFFKKQGMAATGDARHAAAKAAVMQRSSDKKRKSAGVQEQEGAGGGVEQPMGAAGKNKAQVVEQNFTLHPPQPGDVDLQSPQMINPNEIVILPPGPFARATASMAPFRRERGW